MIVEFKKKKEAGRAYGRGSDSFYIPGQYTIIVDGTEVGTIVGRTRRYMEPGAWEIHERYTYDFGPGIPRWNAGQHLFTTVKDAKAYIRRTIGRTYPGS